MPDYKTMMKDGIQLKEIGERVISYARMMDSEQDSKHEKEEAEPKEVDNRDSKAMIVAMLKKKMNK